MGTMRQSTAAKKITSAVERVLNAGKISTPDLGGTATTAEMTDAIVKAMEGKPFSCFAGEGLG